MRPTTRFTLALALTAACALPVAAQEFPTKPVTLVTVLAAGTGLDIVARTYAEKLTQSLGRPVIVDNRPGGSGNVAAVAVKGMPADGHSLLVCTSAVLAINPTTFKQLPYDPKDFVPVAIYLKSPFMLIVDPKLPVNTMAELVAYARERQGKLSFSSPGTGTAPHLATELFKQIYNLDITHVPYKASPQSIVDVSAGTVQLAFAEAGASQRLVQDGRLRALAVSSTTRWSTFPDVPTVAEAANRPGFEAVSWHALVAPAGAPRAAIDRLQAEMARIMAMPDVRARVSSLGLIPVDVTSVADAQKYIAAETEKWGGVVRGLGLAGSQ